MNSIITTENNLLLSPPLSPTVPIRLFRTYIYWVPLYSGSAHENMENHFNRSQKKTEDKCVRGERRMRNNEQLVVGFITK